jgi:hypothetical protein
MENKVDISTLSAEDIAELLKKKKEEERQLRLTKRDAYEGLRNDLLDRLEAKVRDTKINVDGLFDFVIDETGAFRAVMTEYGELKHSEQMSYTLKNDHFKVEIKKNKVKKFDERADVAAMRLRDFLRNWIKGRENGTNDPMYQLAMSLMERNKFGELDYKSISKLYDLEDKFGSDDYSAIMQLFRESNVVNSTATNFYFSELDDTTGVWKRIEVSFCRLN